MMETLQLKRSLHELIDRIADARVLEAIHTLLAQGEPVEESLNADFALDEATQKLFNERIAHYKAHPEEGDSWLNLKTRVEQKLAANLPTTNSKSA